MFTRATNRTLLLGSLVAALVCAVSAHADSATPGAADPTYGMGGLGSFSASHYPKAESANSANDAVQDSSGRILVAGDVAVMSRKWEVPAFASVAFGRDGRRDPSWGKNGAVIEKFPRTGYLRKRDSVANAISTLPDGRVFVAGRVDYVTDREINEGYDTEGDDGGALHISRYNLVVFAYDKHGKRLSSFGEHGKVRIQSVSHGWSLDSPVQLFDMEVAPDGSVYLLYEDDNWDFRAMRLTKRGRLDRNFGHGGVLRIPVPKGTSADDITGAKLFAYASGITVAYGTTTYKGETNRAVWMATRFTKRGKVDAAYGSGGHFRKAFAAGTFSGSSGIPLSIEVDAVGRLIFAGPLAVTEDDDEAADRTSGALIRVNTDGVLDAGFGTGGMVSPQGPDGKPVIVAAVSPLIGGRYAVTTASCSSFTEGSCRQYAWTTRALDASGQLIPKWGTDGDAPLPSDFYGVVRMVSDDSRVYVVFSELWPKSAGSSLFGVYALLN